MQTLTFFNQVHKRFKIHVQRCLTKQLCFFVGIADEIAVEIAIVREIVTETVAGMIAEMIAGIATDQEGLNLRKLLWLSYQLLLYISHFTISLLAKQITKFFYLLILLLRCFIRDRRRSRSRERRRSRSREQKRSRSRERRRERSRSRSRSPAASKETKAPEGEMERNAETAGQ